jgi:hypothetical protein
VTLASEVTCHKVHKLRLTKNMKDGKGTKSGKKTTNKHKKACKKSVDEEKWAWKKIPKEKRTQGQACFWF